MTRAAEDAAAAAAAVNAERAAAGGGAAAVHLRVHRASDVEQIRRLFRDGMRAEDPDGRDRAHARHTERALRWLTAEELAEYYVAFWVACEATDDGGDRGDGGGDDGGGGGGRVVGMVGVLERPDREPEVQRLQVAPQRRRRGIGTLLMRCAERFCRSRGATAITLTTLQLHHKAVALYTRLGWQTVRRYNAGGTSLVEMRRVLSSSSSVAAAATTTADAADEPQRKRARAAPDAAAAASSLVHVPGRPTTGAVYAAAAAAAAADDTDSGGVRAGVRRAEALSGGRITSSGAVFGRRLAAALRRYLEQQQPSHRREPYDAVRDMLSRAADECAGDAVARLGGGGGGDVLLRCAPHDVHERLRLTDEAHVAAAADRAQAAAYAALGRRARRVWREWLPHLRDGPGAAAMAQARRDVEPLAVLAECCGEHATVHITPAECGSSSSSSSSWDAVVRVAAAALSAGDVPFPWKALSVSLSPQQLAANLAAFRGRPSRERCVPHNVRIRSGRDLVPLAWVGGGGDWLSFVSDDADYDAMDVLGDLFNERARLSARRQDTPLAVLEQWRRDPAWVETVVRASAAVERGRGVDAHTLREAVFSAARECTQFKPSLARAVIEHFAARRVLDFSAGWGDRLAAALSTPGLERYCAFDPNTALRPGHDAMIRELGGDPRRFTVTYEPFERAVLPADVGEVDLVLTSPPFWSFEMYSAQGTQSIATYPELPDWTVGFLFTAIARAWSVLRRGGHAVIHIADVFKTQVCEAMCLLVHWRLPDARFLGVMCSRARAGRPRPMWTWQRLAEPRSRDDCERGRDALRQHFPAVFAAAGRLLEADG